MEIREKLGKYVLPRDIKEKSVNSITFRAVLFNLFGGMESQGCIPVAHGAPVHISAQDS